MEQHSYCGKYCCLRLEAWAVGITTDSREVPERTGMWQETTKTTTKT